MDGPHPPIHIFLGDGLHPPTFFFSGTDPRAGAGGGRRLGGRGDGVHPYIFNIDGPPPILGRGDGVQDQAQSQVGPQCGRVYVPPPGDFTSAQLMAYRLAVW